METELPFWIRELIKELEIINQELKKKINSTQQLEDLG